MSMFEQPSAPGDGIQWKDHRGALLLVEVEEFIPEISTNFGVTSAVRASVVVVDGDGKGESYDDTLIFPKILVNQTKGQIGKRVLGRLGQGEAKPGQSAPWLLNEASAADIQLAETWVSQNQQPTTTAPAAPF